MIPLLHTKNACKTYRGTGDSAEMLDVLKNVTIDIFPGDSIAIMGRSGSGKSTLLHILGCFDRPTKGQCFFKGKDTQEFSDKELSAIRSRDVGFVFQAFNLIPHLNVYENVLLPFQYHSDPPINYKEQVLSAIERVNLSHRLHHRPKELSGGEMQRAAIARAIVARPSVVLADEPTGNLDSVNSAAVLALLQQINSEGIAVVVVTHDSNIACRFATSYSMHDGVLSP